MDQNQNPYQNPYEDQSGQYGYQGGQNQGYPQQSQQSYSFELPQQSPYGQYYGAQAKKKLNPLVIIIPAAALVIVGLVVALIFVLNGSGSSGNINGGGSGNVGGGSNIGGNGGGNDIGNGGGNGGGSFVSDDGGDDGAEKDDGIKYDSSGNPVFEQQTLNNSSLTAYNNRNPYDISISIYAAGDVNKLAAVEAGDKKKIQQLIVDSQFTTNGVDYDNSVEMIVGEPVKITYKQQELMQDCEIVFSLPDSLLKSTGHYPTVFSGIDRFTVLYVDENEEMIVDGGDILDSSNNSMTVSGHDGSAYLVMIDGDAMYYGLGIDPALFETDDDGSGSGGGSSSSGGSSSGGQGQDVFTHSTYTTDGKFVCEYLGIAANLGSGWTFDDEETIADKNGIVEVTDEALRKRLESGYVVFDMHSTSNKGYVSLYFSHLYGTVDDYVDRYMENEKESMESIFDEVRITKGNASFAGWNTINVYEECQASNFTTYHMNFYFAKGDVLVHFIFYAHSKAELDEMIACFYAV